MSRSVLMTGAPRVSGWWELWSTWTCAQSDRGLRLSWYPMLAHADGEVSYQTGRIPGLIWVLGGCAFGIFMLRLKCLAMFFQSFSISYSMIKGKGTQKYKCVLSASIRKTAHFDANCMEIGFLLLKLLRFYVFKMATNGGRHFEINSKLKNYQTQFIS